MEGIQIRNPLIVALLILSVPGHILAQQPDKEQRIREHNERIRLIIEESQKRRGTPLSTQTSTAAATRAPVSRKESITVAPDKKKEILQSTNWAKLRDFYFIPEIEMSSYKGIQQEHLDSELKLRWGFGSDAAQFQYLWINTSATQELTNAKPISAEKIMLLRRDEQCAKVLIDPSQNLVEVSRWQQKDELYVAGRLVVMNPHARGIFMGVPAAQILVTSDFPQRVNGWDFRVTTQSRVLTLTATNVHTQQTVAIGQRTGDYCPLNDMIIRINAGDPEQMAFLFEIERGGPDNTAFAYTTTEEFVETAGSLTTATLLSKALENLGQRFMFKVKYADASAHELASKHFFRQPYIYSNDSTVMAELEKSLYPEFYPEISTPDLVTVHVSPAFLADHNEKPQLLEKFKAQYAYHATTYHLKEISAETAEQLVSQKLGQYIIMPGELAPENSHALKGLSGDYYSVIKLPADETVPPFGQIINSDPESVIADSEYNAVVVTATAVTHEEISSLLDAVDTHTTTGENSTSGSSLTTY